MSHSVNTRGMSLYIPVISPQKSDDHTQGKNSCFSRGKRFFTLIEVLVVIAIIALLAAILLPALQSTRARGRAAGCISNLKQLGIMQNQYTDLFDGWFCPLYYMNADWSVTYWDWANASDFTEDHEKSGLLAAALNMNGGTSAVHACPDNNMDKSGSAKNSGYGYNTLLGFDQYGGAGYKITQVSNASKIIMFGDSATASLSNPAELIPTSLLYPPESGGYNVSYSHFRHLRSTTVVFTDGHAESAKEIFIGQNGRGNFTMAIGYCSEDNEKYNPEFIK